MTYNSEAKLDKSYLQSFGYIGEFLTCCTTLFIFAEQDLLSVECLFKKRKARAGHLIIFYTKAAEAEEKRKNIWNI